MIRKLIALFALAAALLPAPAFAYWEYGHQTVAAIAWKNIKPSTRAEIRKLLAEQELLGTPACPAGTIEEAAVWADCIKKLGPDYKYASNWHFTDIEICKPYDLEAACKDGNCLYEQLKRDLATLKDRRAPAADRVKALVFLIHFVGDMHQPLHASDREDMGGNKVEAAWGIYSPQRFNLHSVWDGPLAERAGSTGPSLVRSYSPAERRKLAGGTVAEWTRQSWELARNSVYAPITANGDPCGPIEGRVVFEGPLVDKLVPVARLQLKRGGVRLAKLLDMALAAR